MQIRAKTLAEAHLRVCKEIYLHGDEVLSEDGEITFEYPEPVLIIVSDPLSTPMVCDLCKFGEMAMAEYVDQFLNGCDSGFVYTYHDRVFNYDCCGSGGTNQIEKIVKKARDCPTSRRLQAITWYPDKDLDSANPPCLQRLQFLIRNGKLNLDANFRSNDCLSALGQNMYIFVNLLKCVADRLGLAVGIYSHYITSAHIYPIRDASELGLIREAICQDSVINIAHVNNEPPLAVAACDTRTNRRLYTIVDTIMGMREWGGS